MKDSKTMGFGSDKQEKVYLMEARNGLLVRVPESRLEAWQAAQEQGSDPAFEDTKRRLADKIVQKIYGSRR